MAGCRLRRFGGVYRRFITMRFAEPPSIGAEAFLHGCAHDFQPRHLHDSRPGRGARLGQRPAGAEDWHRWCLAHRRACHAHSQIAALLVSFLLVAVFFSWLKCSDLGLRFRGLSDNPVEMELLGYDTDNLRTLAFGISGFLAAAAGILNAYDLGFDPNIGMSAVMLAIVATIIGGRGTFIGPVIGGLLLGIVRSQVVWHASARWQDAITFFLLAIFLLCRPNGIVGSEKRLEANE